MVVGARGIVPKDCKGFWTIKNQMKNSENSDNCIGKIGQSIEKSSGELSKLDVTQRLADAGEKNPQ